MKHIPNGSLVLLGSLVLSVLLQLVGNGSLILGTPFRHATAPSSSFAWLPQEVREATTHDDYYNDDDDQAKFRQVRPRGINLQKQNYHRWHQNKMDIMGTKKKRGMTITMMTMRTRMMMMKKTNSQRETKNGNNKKLRKASRVQIPVEHLKVPLPIFVLSLPKSGTTSLYSYFTCGKVFAAHTFGRDYQTGEQFRLGRCLYNNYIDDQPMLQGCGTYKVYTDLGFVAGPNDCWYPSIEAIDRIASDYPHATLIVSHRPGWYESITQYRGLLERWTEYCPQFPNTTEESVWENLYAQHRQRIRRVVEENPSLTHFEFDLTDPLAGKRLENFTGVSQECWADCKPNMNCFTVTEESIEMERE